MATVTRKKNIQKSKFVMVLKLLSVVNFLIVKSERRAMLQAGGWRQEAREGRGAWGARDGRGAVGGRAGGLVGARAGCAAAVGNTPLTTPQLHTPAPLFRFMLSITSAITDLLKFEVVADIFQPQPIRHHIYKLLWEYCEMNGERSFRTWSWSNLTRSCIARTTEEMNDNDMICSFFTVL